MRAEGLAPIGCAVLLRGSRVCATSRGDWPIIRFRQRIQIDVGRHDIVMADGVGAGGGRGARAAVMGVAALPPCRETLPAPYRHRGWPAGHSRTSSARQPVPAHGPDQVCRPTGDSGRAAATVPLLARPGTGFAGSPAR